MKRTFTAGLLLVVMLLVAAACGGAATDQGPAGNGSGSGGETGGQQTVTYNLSIATGGTGGTYYPVGGALAEVWQNHIEGLTVTPQATGGSVENLRLLDAGEAELALAQNNTADYAYNGTSIDFEGNPITSFRAIGVVYPEIVQIFSRPDIERIEDLKGKRVAVGPPGSGTEASAREIFEFYGLNHVPGEGKEVNIEPHYLTVAESGDAFRDGHVDAVFVVLSAPGAVIQDVAAQHEIRLHSITGEPLERIREKYPFYAPIEVPAGTYPNQDEPFYSVSLQATLFAREDLDEELVYQLTKVLYEHADEIAQRHDKGNDIKLERALDGVTVPVHPGAERYYREKGLIN